MHFIEIEPNRSYSYILVRDVSPSECRWLERTYKKGDLVYLYRGHTYKCIGAHGAAFTLKAGLGPFFELPNDAVKLVHLE